MSAWVGHLFRIPTTFEEWGDAVSLGSLAVMWWVMLAYELQRTWKWDGLGRVLTAKTVMLGLTASITTLQLFLNVVIWTPPVRWTSRGVLVAIAFATILTLKHDQPPARPDEGETDA